MSSVCAQGAQRRAVWLQCRIQRAAQNRPGVKGTEGGRGFGWCADITATNTFCGIRISLGWAPLRSGKWPFLTQQWRLNSSVSSVHPCRCKDRPPPPPPPIPFTDRGLCAPASMSVGWWQLPAPFSWEWVSSKQESWLPWGHAPPSPGCVYWGTKAWGPWIKGDWLHGVIGVSRAAWRDELEASLQLRAPPCLGFPLSYLTSLIPLFLRIFPQWITCSRSLLLLENPTCFGGEGSGELE